MKGPNGLGLMLAAVLAAGGLVVSACGTSDAGGARGAATAEASTSGLSGWAHGCRLVVERTQFRADKQARFAFRIVDGTGRPVRTFDTDRTKRMHVIVVRRDLTGFQHLHPAMSSSGRWSVPLTLPTSGTYRAFADFVVDGHRTVLGADLKVPGPAPMATPPVATRTATTGGYVVRLNTATGGRLAFTVSRTGKPVTDLQPYLGAAGHLVVLRERDLSYLHTHPDHAGHADHAGAMSAGPTIAFATRLPTGARYRAFLQFRAAGAVRTAAFTLAVGS